MIVETKFNIGQSVHYIFLGRIESKKIYCIKINILLDNKPEIWYHLEDDILKNEVELFESIDVLIRELNFAYVYHES